MTLCDKFNIIDIQNHDNTQIFSKLNNWLENYINTDIKIMMASVFYNLPISDDEIKTMTNNHLNNFLTQCRNNIRKNIKKDNFNLEAMNKFIINFIQKLKYISTIAQYSKLVYDDGINLLSSLILTDSIIIMYIQDNLIELDEDNKKHFKTLLTILNTEESHDVYNKMLQIIKTGFKKNVLNFEELPIPINYKRMQKLYNMVDYYNKIRDHFNYLTENNNLVVVNDVKELIFSCLFDIFNNNSLMEVSYLFNKLLKSFTFIIKDNNDNHNYSSECIKFIDRCLKQDNLDFQSFIVLVEQMQLIIKDNNHKQIIINKIGEIFSNNDNIQHIHNYIDMSIKNNNNIATSISYIKFVQNKDKFINKYYEYLVKRLTSDIKNMQNIINREIEASKELAKYFENKYLYKINKEIDYALNSINFRYHLDDTKHEIYITPFEGLNITQSMGLISSKQLEISDYINNYVVEYKKFTENKKTLNLIAHCGEVIISYLEHDFVMFPIHYIILNMFNENTSVTLDDIKSMPMLSNYSQQLDKYIQCFIISGLLTVSKDTVLILETCPKKILKTNLINIYMEIKDNDYEFKVEKEIMHSREEITTSVINHVIKKSPLKMEDMYKQTKEMISLFPLEKELFEKVVSNMVKNDYIENRDSIYYKLVY